MLFLAVLAHLRTMLTDPGLVPISNETFNSRSTSSRRLMDDDDDDDDEMSGSDSELNGKYVVRFF